MHGDLDDTRLVVPRLTESDRGVDHDDTVVRGSLPAVAPAAPTVAPLPALIEPPLPEARSIPKAIDPFPEPTPDPEPAPVEAPEPQHLTPAAFLVLLPDGTELPVDGPVYVGRKPSAPRIHTGPAPRLVTFPSPSRELSATHLELRVVGGALVASDMRSTNGTVVRLPRTAPRTLIRGESVVVVPGTRIDLGDGAVLDILAAPENLQNPEHAETPDAAGAP